MELCVKHRGRRVSLTLSEAELALPASKLFEWVGPGCLIVCGDRVMDEATPLAALSEVTLRPWLEPSLEDNDRVDPWAVFSEDDRLTLWRPPTPASLRGLRNLGLSTDEPTDDEPSEFDTLRVPKGVDRRAWTRLLTAREWKADGDALLASRKHVEAVRAYDQALDLVEDDVMTWKTESQAWALRRLRPAVTDLAEALAVSKAVAAILAGEPQTALDALDAKSTDVDVVFTRAQALRRLSLPKLALDVLNTIDVDTAMPDVAECQRRTLARAKTNLQAALDSGPRVRRTKKRW